MQLVDLSHTIRPDLTRFPILPSPKIRPFLTHAESAASGRYERCSVEISFIETPTSVGTYVDAPFHFDPQGARIHELPLERLVATGLVVDVAEACLSGTRAISPEVLSGLDVADKAVLFYTGWDRYWEDPARYGEHPYLTGATAQRLLDGGVRLVGMDALIIDPIADRTRPAQSTLLPAGLCVVKNLRNLSAVVGLDFLFIGVPPKVAGVSAFPIRAFAMLQV